MVKLIGPGLGASASGSVGDALTYSHTGRGAYAKKHAAPKQPRTANQVAMRTIMTFLAEEWSLLPPAHQATWESLANLSNISPFNAYQAENCKRWRNRLCPSQYFPATETQPTAFGIILNAAGAVRHVTLSIAAYGSIEKNWSIIILHQFGSAPAAVWNRLIHVHRIVSLAAAFYHHQDLAPGAHYYKAWACSEDGNISWPTITDDDTVVT